MISTCHSRSDRPSQSLQYSFTVSVDGFYTPFADANEDGLNHVRFSPGRYAFEERSGLGNRDFNDFVLNVDLAPIA